MGGIPFFGLEEYLDILDKHGKPLGESYPKSIVHQKGYYHNTVHIWFYTSNGEVLLAQRSLKKAICPGLWDVSVAGHVDSGETFETAATREVWEEIGLKIEVRKLSKIGVFECFQDYEFGISDYEFHHTYLYQLTVPVNQLTPQPDEVEALKLVPLETFSYFIQNAGKDNHLVSSNKAYYLKVLTAIRELIPGF